MLVFSDCRFEATDCFVITQEKEFGVGYSVSSKNTQKWGLHREQLLHYRKKICVLFLGVLAESC